MLKNIKVLLKADYQGWVNNFKHSGETWRKGVFKGISYLILIVALSILGNSLFSHLRLTDAEPALLLGVINGFMTFGLIVIAKELMEGSLRILYEAPDTAILHATPIRPITIFGYKFVHLTLTRVLSILCFLGPPWIMFGLIFELPWHFYVALLPTCVCLLIIIASYITISVMLITRFFSSGGLLATLKVLGIAVSVTVGFLLPLTLFTTFDSIPVKQFLLDWVAPETEGASPKWIGQLLLLWTTESTIESRLKWTVGGIGGCLASAGVAILAAHLMYQRGWENIRLLKVSKRKPVRRNGDSKVSPLKGIVVALGRGKIKAMMLKDFLIFVRHSGRLIAILMLTLFLAVHIGFLFIQGGSMSTGEGLTVQIVLYSIFITFGISCNGVRDEAKTWWVLKSAPVTPRLVFTSKFLTSLVCALIYAEFWALVAVYLLPIPRDNWMSVLLIPIMVLPAGSALNTAVGTLPWMAELTQQPKPVSRVVTFAVTFVVDIGLVVAPVIAWHTESTVLLVGLTVILAGVLVVSYKWGIGNLRKLLVAQL